MPRIYLSPSTQEWNLYINGGTEEDYMNLVADAMEPYLLASGISFTRNTPDMTAASSIAASNNGDYDAHVSLHSNAAPEALSGELQGTERILPAVHAGFYCTCKKLRGTRNPRGARGGYSGGVR